MASLSIVVPRLGPNDYFENTLASILRYRMPSHQVLVIQSDLQADTYGLESEVDFVEVSGKKSLARYLNLAIPAVSGETVNVIRPGIEVTHQWFAHGIRALQDPSVGSVACSLVAANFRDEVISHGLASGRSMLPRHSTDALAKTLGASCWAGFYRGNVLQALGQLDETLSDDFVGLDLALSLRHLGFGCRVVTDRVLSIADEQLLCLQHNSKTGCDAKRMIQRHVKRSEQGMSSAIALTSELLGNAWRPSRWSRLIGRLSARNRQATDRGFLRRLDLARHALAETQLETVRTVRRAA